MLAVSNTSPIFNLACIGRLDLLRTQFDEIWIPSGVETVLIQIPDATIRGRIEQARSGGWLSVRPTTEADLVKLLTVDLHQGEAEAIGLALETRHRLRPIGLNAFGTAFGEFPDARQGAPRRGT